MTAKSVLAEFTRAGVCVPLVASTFLEQATVRAEDAPPAPLTVGRPADEDGCPW